MKNIILLISISLFLFSCEKDSLDEGFENANPNVKEKLIKQFELFSDDWSDADGTTRINYNSENIITSITSEGSTQFFYYDDFGNLDSITGDSDGFFIDQIFEEIGDSAVAAYKWGDVLKYDDKGNPEEVELLRGSLDIPYSPFGGIDEHSIAYISYDPIPNPFYYSLKAGGIIDVLNNIYLDFGYGPKELIIAKKMLLFNFPNLIMVKKISGSTEAEIHFENTVDDDDYLTRSEVFFASKYNSETTVLRFAYKE
jgi:YD repeat-containing protein